MISLNISKKLFIFLILTSLSFASWQTIAGLTILTSFSILIILFVIGYGFGMEELKILSKDEMYQLLVTIILIALLVSAEGFLNSFSESLGSYTGETKTIQLLALDSLNDSMGNSMQILSELRTFSQEIGFQATQSTYCNLLGSGIFTSPCGAYNTPLPSIAVASQMLSLSLAEFGSLYFLITLGMNYAFNFILPLGLILRTLKITRGAGAFFIALGICLYFILPLSILSLNLLIGSYESTNNITIPNLSLSNSLYCSTADSVPENINKIQTLLSTYMFTSPIPGEIDVVESLTFYFLISSTFLVVITMLIFLVSLQALTSICGAEVDVSVLGKLA